MGGGVRREEQDKKKGQRWAEVMVERRVRKV